MERNDFTPIVEPEPTAEEQAALDLLKPYLHQWHANKAGQLDNDTAAEADVTIIEHR